MKKFKKNDMVITNYNFHRKVLDVGRPLNAIKGSYLNKVAENVNI